MKQYSKAETQNEGELAPTEQQVGFQSPLLCGTGHLMGSDTVLSPHLLSSAVIPLLQDRYYLHRRVSETFPLNYTFS